MTDQKCQDALSELHRYLDHELDAATVVQLEIHLRQCSPCLEAYDFEAELRRVVAKGCKLSAPTELRAKVLDALKACGSESDPNPA